MQTYQQVPERIGIVLQTRDGEINLSYKNLLDHAASYAKAYQAAGIQPGEPIILLLQHGHELITSFFGAILHGAIPAIMPFLTEKLSPERYRNSLESLIKITRPAAVVTYAEFLDEVEGARQPKDSIRAVLIPDQQIDLIDWTWEELEGNQSKPGDTVLLQHSSGTTGLQKGVALSHQAVLNQIEAYAAAIQLSDDDVVVSWLPLYHDMGLIAGFIMPILARIKLVLMSPFDWVRAPHRLMTAISTHRGTLCWLPNFAYNFCTKKIRDRDLEDVDLSSWRAVINCSEPMRWESHEMFYDRFHVYGLRRESLATCYAMAENVFAVTQGGISEPVKVDVIERLALQSHSQAVPTDDPERSVRMLSAGTPIMGTEIRVVDKNGDDLPERSVGEIIIRGNCLLNGYFNRPDLTDKAFFGDWYRTGDLGYLSDGHLYITGREKELIIVGGKNIHPQDLEEIVNQIDGIHPGRVVAFGIYNENLGTEEVAIVAESSFESDSEKLEVSRLIRDSIARNTDVAARHVLVVEREWLIKTSSGKIARGANREKYLESLN
jgi:acyl-CoA synthetase (AMP-forming)/AMP-acid ligase II